MDTHGPYAERSDVPFTGSINGDGHTISGLTVNLSSSYAGAGLFAYNKGTIKDLTIANANIRAGAVAGVLAGQNAGTIENCHVSGTVTTTSYTLASLGSSPTYTGSFTGGLVGVNGGNIGKCSAKVDVANTYTTNEGSDAISGCLGGLVGINYGGTITESWANGGINKSWYQGSQISGNWYFAGGLVGHNDSNSVIRNCWAYAQPICAHSYVGGLVGMNRNSTIASSYGRVSGWTIGAGAGNTAGDCIGYNQGGTISNAYYAYSSASGFGTRLNTLTDGAILAGFDTAIWRFQNGAYPNLINNPR